MNNEILQTADLTYAGGQDVVAQSKAYVLRPLRASEFFPVLTILRKIGFKNFTALLQQDVVKDLVVKLKNGETDKIAEDEILGVGSVIFEIVDIIIAGMERCETEVFTLLSNVSGEQVERIKEFDITTFTEMLIDLIKSNVDFIKAVSKYLI